MKDYNKEKKQLRKSKVEFLDFLEEDQVGKSNLKKIDTFILSERKRFLVYIFHILYIKIILVVSVE
jgi:hypothetical protein